MNRKHTIERYLNVYEKLKKINTNIEFSSDFIIAYPEENDQDFNDTLDLIKKIKFVNSYSFIFSPRPGTVAGDLKLIEKTIADERLNIIQKELFKNQIIKNKSLEKKSLKVLVENQMKNKTKLFGRTEYMTSVIFEGSKENIGKIVEVEIDSSNQHTLFGILKLNDNKRVA